MGNYEFSLIFLVCELPQILGKDGKVVFHCIFNGLEFRIFLFLDWLVCKTKGPIHYSLEFLFGMGGGGSAQHAQSFFFISISCVRHFILHSFIYHFKTIMSQQWHLKVLIIVLPQIMKRLCLILNYLQKIVFIQNTQYKWLWIIILNYYTKLY